MTAGAEHDQIGVVLLAQSFIGAVMDVQALIVVTELAPIAGTLQGSPSRLFPVRRLEILVIGHRPGVAGDIAIQERSPCCQRVGLDDLVSGKLPDKPEVAAIVTLKLWRHGNPDMLFAAS